MISKKTCPPEQVNVTLFGKKESLQIQDKVLDKSMSPVLPRQALNPVTRLLIIEEETHRRRSCEDGVKECVISRKPKAKECQNLEEARRILP